MNRRYTPTIQFDKRSNRPLNESRDHDDFGTAVYDSEYAVKDVSQAYKNILDAGWHLEDLLKKIKHNQEEITNYSEAMSKELVRLNNNPKNSENIKDVVFTVIECVEEHKGYSNNINDFLYDIENAQKDVRESVKHMKKSLKDLNDINRDVMKYAKKL